MKTMVSRRNLLKFVGGSAAGIMLSPLPWKTLDDLAIWTQNWSWTPIPPRGEIRYKFSTCALCPIGCGIRARCVGQNPVSLTGVKNHPVNRGALCPGGFGGHHLAFHPLRTAKPLKQTQHNGITDWAPTTLDDVISSIASTVSEIKVAGSKESIAILDPRPGRSLSSLYREFVSAMPNGVYVIPPSPVAHSFAVLSDMLDQQSGQYGVDPEQAGTILSFGAPIMDGWGSPGVAGQILNRRQAGNIGGGTRLVQIETRQSRTASLADRWLPIKPGSESALALGLAHIIIKEKLIDLDGLQQRAGDFDGGAENSYKDLVERFTPGFAASIAGIPPEIIIEVAREAAFHTPTVVIGGGDSGAGPFNYETEMAIWGLNFLLGSIGTSAIPRIAGSVVTNAETGRAVKQQDLDSVPDHSIRILIMDLVDSADNAPWRMIEKKLVAGKALVIGLSPFMSGLAKHAGYVIPTPAHLETFQDLPGTVGSSKATYAISIPLLKAQPSVIEPMHFIQRVAGATQVSLRDPYASAEYVDLLKSRVHSIHGSGRGKVFIPGEDRTTGTSEVGSPDQLWKLLTEGGCWFDGPEEKQAAPRFTFLGRSGGSYQRLLAAGEGRQQRQHEQSASFPLILMPYDPGGTASWGQITPLMSKIYRESGLRDQSSRAAINPETGRNHGLSDGKEALVETAQGKMRIAIHFDATVLPGVLQVAVGPDFNETDSVAARTGQNILSLCNVNEDAGWRLTPAKITEA